MYDLGYKSYLVSRKHVPHIGAKKKHHVLEHDDMWNEE